jgi:hypothetical protein
MSAARKQVLNWIMECKKFSKKEINVILNRVEVQVLSNSRLVSPKDQKRETSFSRS